MTATLHHRLQQLRHALLDLHKTLVDSERMTYQQTFGPIQSPSHFLKLLTGDPWFAWLHPISLLIVAMDEALEAKKEPLTAPTVDNFLKQTRQLLVASETSEGFAKDYYDALQRDPDVVLAHAAVARIISPKDHGARS